LAEIPTVLRTDLYAVAALAGAAVVVIGSVLHLPSAAATIVGALLCFALRLIAIHWGWRLPIARQQNRSAGGIKAPDNQRDDRTMKR
ncbi:MAG: trimeric intracellular cation channel family protein, partial [Alphaproteobacteria bacterium]|nr:trimeric intracellular cation channel family protein [Alphaproteobacteria bacterium]